MLISNDLLFVYVVPEATRTVVNFKIFQRELPFKQLDNACMHVIRIQTK